jgi:glycosyltransferase involved in cell wall biosynthesis
VTPVAARLSAVVVAQDEARNLPGCLASLGFCDEVVVVDGGSRDQTRDLARAAGARVVERPFDHFAAQHEHGLAQAAGPWILSIDADERATPALAEAARAIADAPPSDSAPSAYALPFKNHFAGRWLRFGGLWPDRHLRLFRKDRCSYDPARPVHEKLLVKGITQNLDAPVLHYTWTGAAHCLEKSARYGEQAARGLFAQGRRASLLRLVFSPLWRFVRGYFLRLGLLDGGPGLVVARARAYEAYVRESRLRALWSAAGAGLGAGR